MTVGWTYQLTPRAREFGVDFSVYNPNDKAQTVAVFIKPVPGLASVGVPPPPAPDWMDTHYSNF
jgi:hypothetical protein